MIALWVWLTGCSASPSAPPPASAPPQPAEVAGPESIDLAVRRDAAWIGVTLARIERAIRDPAVSDAEAGEKGHLQQRIYRLLAEDPVLASTVVERSEGDLRGWIQRNIAGTASIARTVPSPKTDLPPWRIVEPSPAAELLGHYRAAEQVHGIPWHVLASIHLNETRMGRLRGTSDAGAKGPMQFMPATWAAYGDGDIERDADAISAAARYLAAMGFDRDRRKALWHYNHSDAYIDAILSFSEVMADDARAYRGYWGWQVYYRTIRGSIWLSSGYESLERQPIDAWCGSRGEPHCPALGDEPGASGR